MVRDVRGRRGAAAWLLVGVCFAVAVPAAMRLYAEEPVRGPQPRRAAIGLTPEQRRDLDSARKTLKQTSLSGAEQQVRLCLIEAAMAGTVAGPDEDNPEILNPRLWTLTEQGYVVAGNSTAVEAIDDLWTVHHDDGVPLPRVWCYKYSLLVMARAYIQYFHDAESAAGLAAMNSLIGHKAFPDGMPNEGEGVLWKTRRASADLLPGDQVWFENPYYVRGRELIRQTAYAEAVGDGHPVGEAAAIADETADNAAAGEQGSNVFYLGDNQVARGAFSVARASCGGRASPAYEQVCTRKIFAIPRYQQHMVDDYYTVQACMEASPGSVSSGDFQIKRVRALLDPETLIRFSSDKERLWLGRLIGAMASRNKAPALADFGNEQIPLFADDYDWAEQERVARASWRC